jgi:hypothetical protein
MSATAPSLPSPACTTDRSAIVAEASGMRAVSGPSAYEMLRIVDPLAAEKLHPNDARKIDHALKVFTPPPPPPPHTHTHAHTPHPSPPPAAAAARNKNTFGIELRCACQTFSRTGRKPSEVACGAPKLRRPCVLCCCCAVLGCTAMRGWLSERSAVPGGCCGPVGSVVRRSAPSAGVRRCVVFWLDSESAVLDARLDARVEVHGLYGLSSTAPSLN